MKTFMTRHQWPKAVMLMLLGIIAGCETSDDADNTGCIRSGLYDYSLFMSLYDDQNASFPDGSEYQTWAGRTSVSATSNGFFFKGGENDRREITATCIDATTASVEILLHNQCASNYTTRSTATLDIWDDGSMSISSYSIQWTCGLGASAFAAENWMLWPR